MKPQTSGASRQSRHTGQAPPQMNLSLWHQALLKTLKNTSSLIAHTGEMPLLYRARDHPCYTEQEQDLRHENPLCYTEQTTLASISAWSTAAHRNPMRVLGVSTHTCQQVTRPLTHIGARSHQTPESFTLACPTRLHDDMTPCRGQQAPESCNCSRPELVRKRAHVLLTPASKAEH
jgi:hypothetical protein